MSYAEVVDQARNITDISIPVIADGDTGYGNAMNVGERSRVLLRRGAPGF